VPVAVAVVAEPLYASRSHTIVTAQRKDPPVARTVLGSPSDVRPYIARAIESGGA